MPALFGKFAHVSPKIPDPTEMRGLTHAEACVRLQAEGMNELPAARSRDIPVIALEVVREPMFLLLLVAGVIYLLLGDVSDALMLLGFVCMVMGITIYQKLKTERVLTTGPHAELGKIDKALQVLNNETTPLQISCNIELILVNRSWQLNIFSSLNNRNSALWCVACGALTFLLLTVHLPFLREIFHFAPLIPYQLALSFAAGLCSVLWFELLKLIRRH